MEKHNAENILLIIRSLWNTFNKTKITIKDHCIAFVIEFEITKSILISFEIEFQD